MTRMRFFLSAAVLALLPASVAAQDQPFTIDDMLQVEDLAEPVFAPDGNSIAYVVTSPGDGDTTQSDLWTARWDGSQAMPLYPTIDRDEAMPRWSADGLTFAFLRSGADGAATQLWASREGEPPRQVTTLPGGVEEYTLSPDGLQAVVVSEVGEHVSDEEPAVAPPIVLTRFTLKEDGRGWLDDRRKQLHRVVMASGEATQITTGDYDNWYPAWSPDGQSVAFVSRRCEQRDRIYCSDVFVIPPEGGEPRRVSLSDDPDGEPSSGAGGPQWSPDSQHLVWTRGGPENTIWYSPHQPVVADLATGEEHEVAWIDRWFFQPRFAADGEHLLALVEQDRDTWLGRIDIATGTISYLTSGRRFAYDYAEARDGRLVVMDGDPLTPTQLRTLEPRSRVLSPQNAWLANRALLDMQDVSWTSEEGVEVHGMLMLPPGHMDGQTHPLVVRAHGGPVYQFSHEFQADWQILAQAGYAVLAVNPRGSSGRGAAWAQAQMQHWGGPDVVDVMAGITHAIGLGVIDEDAIGITGWSYGGILSDYMIASDPRIKAAVSGAGIANILGGYGVDQYAREYELELGLPWVETQRWMDLSYPFFHADRITAPTLFLCGEVDWNVPCTGGQQMYQALRANDVPSMLVVYPGQTHGLVVPSYQRDRMERILAWFGQYLRGETPAS